MVIGWQRQIIIRFGSEKLLLEKDSLQIAISLYFMSLAFMILCLYVSMVLCLYVSGKRGVVAMYDYYERQ